ncbi:MAG: SDR family oxidoreductase [Solirubrobacterales bacterium]|nr:SDR family oxidoreductase [Solirubrobacterales bacterium]
MISVIGGRSKIGSAVIRELLARGERVRALARAGERGGFADGVEAVDGDLADPGSLVAAMEGVERVFLLCGPREDEVRLNQNAIDAAEEADVSLLVRSSILGADPDSPSTFVRDHGICDAYLRDSNVDHAIVRPNMFMQNIPESTIPSIGEDGVFYANAGKARISMVDTRDVGAVTAVLLSEEGHDGQELDVTGPEALSYFDVAAKLTTALGREVIYAEAPDDAVRQALAGFGLGDWMVKGLVELFEDYRRSGEDGYAAQVTDVVQRLTGRAPRALDQLLSEVG